MGRVETIRELVLEGGPRQRGRCHGETLRAEIRAMVDDWKQDIQAGTGLHPDRFLERFLAESNYLPAIQRWTPDLLEEVEGIAEGAGLPFGTILARQLSDEEPWFRLEVCYGRYWAHAERCSALGAGPGPSQPPLIAQNMDTPAYYDGYQVLLRIRPPACDGAALAWPEGQAGTGGPEPEVLVLTIAGKISLAGLNSRGLGICCNSLVQLDFCRDGLPEDFVVRGVLAQPHLDGALAFMRAVRHASGQNYLLGDPGRVVDLEVSAGQICEVPPDPVGGRLWHTNHPLANPDQAIWNRRLGAAPPELVRPFLARSTSQARLASIAGPPGGSAGPLTVAGARAALSSHDGPVCIHGDPGDKISLACLIMELEPRPLLHLSPGPPCSTPWSTYGFGGDCDGV